MKKIYPGMNGRPVLAGSLPSNERTWGTHDRTEGYNRYSCNVGFEQEWYQPTGYEKYGPINDHLVSGSPDEPPFSISFNSRALKYALPFSNHAGSTDRQLRENNMDLFTHFPQNRDPCEVWFRLTSGAPNQVGGC